MNCEECEYYDQDEGYCKWLACDGLDCDEKCPGDKEVIKN